MALSKAFSISELYVEEEFAQDETYGTPESIECVDAEVIHVPVTVEQLPAEVKPAEPEKKKPSRIYSKEHMDIARNNFKEIFGRELSQEEIYSCRMPDGYMTEIRSWTCSTGKNDEGDYLSHLF